MSIRRLALLCPVLLVVIAPGAAPGDQSAPQDATASAVAAARAFLDSLDAAQRARANIGFTVTTRAVWSNLPTGITLQSGATERNGLKLGDMTPAQEKAFIRSTATRPTITWPRRPRGEIRPGACRRVGPDAPGLARRASA